MAHAGGIAELHDEAGRNALLVFAALGVAGTGAAYLVWRLVSRR